MKRTQLLGQWQERITEYRASGLSAVRWCEKTGHSVWQLRYWVKKIDRLTGSSDTPGWAKVEIANGTGCSGITVCVGVARIEVESGFDRRVLGEVLKVAASIC